MARQIFNLLWNASIVGISLPHEDALLGGQLAWEVPLRNGIFPAISVNKDSQSPAVAATTAGLVSPEGTQQGKKIPAI